MKSNFKNRILKGLMATSAITPFIAFTPVMAQEQKVEADKGAETVVVTARRREETLKDVPIAVSTFSAAKLENTGAADITALQKSTPNLTMQVARGTNSTLIGFIRGVGQQDPLWGFDPGVGLYVDDVYIARPQGAVLDIYDVSRIEVLRGPQGTLYGRNTIGGAIKYVTKKLGSTPRLNAKLAYGSYNQADVTVSGSMPLNDMFSIGGAFTTQTRDGYGTNLTTGKDQYNKDVFAYRLSAEFNPNDAFSARFSYDNYVDNSNAKHGHREVVALGAGGTPVYTGANAYLGLPTSNVYDTYSGLGDKNKVENEGESLILEYKVNNALTLKSITAARKGHTDTVIDFDGTPSKLLDVPAYYGDTQASQELQAVFTGDKFSGVAGVYYLNATAEGAFDTQVLNGLATTLTRGKVATNSLSYFADFSYKFNDQFSVSIGGRHTKDNKRGTVVRANYGAAASPLFGGTSQLVTLMRTNYTNTRSFSKFTPRISASYAFTPDMTAYASISEGFKSGGFDMRGDAIFTPTTVNGYAPENVRTYEVGLKGSLLDNALSFSSAIFRSDYKDVQITRQVPVGSTIASQVDNAGEATIQGVEFEGNYRVNSMVSLNATIGYIDAQYDVYTSRNPVSGLVENLAGLAAFQNTPKWTNNFGATIKVPAFGGNVIVSPTAAYRSDMQMFEFAAPTLDQKAFWLYDLSAVWVNKSNDLKIGLYAKNLSDERYKVGGYNFPWGVAQGQSVILGNSVTSFYGPPRTYTISIQKTF